MTSSVSSQLFSVISADQVVQHLPMGKCIDVIRDVMRRFSNGDTAQLPRHILPIPGGALGVMAGGVGTTFGAKLLSVFPGRTDGLPTHQGGIMLFDGPTGSPIAIVHAGAITGIRTAAASAVATDQLARAGASSLAILGYGEQAHAHVAAMRAVRPIERIQVWGRDSERTKTFVAGLGQETGLACTAATSVAEATRDADIICTTTGAADPILFAADVREGAHVNVVGSSRFGPSEIGEDLVKISRYFGDSRSNILEQGTEFMRAREQGLIDDSHFLDEIGGLLAHGRPGRTSETDVTIYKSLGHVVQDLAAAEFVLNAVRTAGTAQSADF